MNDSWELTKSITLELMEVSNTRVSCSVTKTANIHKDHIASNYVCFRSIHLTRDINLFCLRYKCMSNEMNTYLTVLKHLFANDNG